MSRKRASRASPSCSGGGGASSDLPLSEGNYSLPSDEYLRVSVEGMRQENKEEWEEVVRMRGLLGGLEQELRELEDAEAEESDRENDADLAVEQALITEIQNSAVSADALTVRLREAVDSSGMQATMGNFQDVLVDSIDQLEDTEDMLRRDIEEEQLPQVFELCRDAEITDLASSGPQENPGVASMSAENDAILNIMS